MNAFVVVEFNVKDSAALSLYVSQAGPLIASHGGEVIGRGPMQVLHGPASTHERSVIIAFPSADNAMDWYRSPAYAKLHAQRELGMRSGFKLVG